MKSGTKSALLIGFFLIIILFCYYHYPLRELFESPPFVTENGETLSYSRALSTCASYKTKGRTACQNWKFGGAPMCNYYDANKFTLDKYTNKKSKTPVCHIFPTYRLTMGSDVFSFNDFAGTSYLMKNYAGPYPEEKPTTTPIAPPATIPVSQPTPIISQPAPIVSQAQPVAVDKNQLFLSQQYTPSSNLVISQTTPS